MVGRKNPEGSVRYALINPAGKEVTNNTIVLLVDQLKKRSHLNSLS